MSTLYKNTKYSCSTKSTQRASTKKKIRTKPLDPLLASSVSNPCRPPARNTRSSHRRTVGQREHRRREALERAAKDPRPEDRGEAVAERPSAGDPVWAEEVELIYILYTLLQHFKWHNQIRTKKKNHAHSMKHLGEGIYAVVLALWRHVHETVQRYMLQIRDSVPAIYARMIRDS